MSGTKVHIFYEPQSRKLKKNKLFVSSLMSRKRKNRGYSLERVAYGYVETEGVAEAGHIVVAAAAGGIGSMNTYADVEAQDKKVEVVAEAEACAEGYVVEELAGIDSGAWSVVVRLHEPYVAGVNEKGSFERANEWEAIFNVGFQLEVAYLVHVAPS